MKHGWQKTSGQWKRSTPPGMMMLGTESFKVISFTVLSAVDFSSTFNQTSEDFQHQKKEKQNNSAIFRTSCISKRTETNQSGSPRTWRARKRRMTKNRGDGRKGRRHRREGLAQGSRSEGEVVGACTGAPLQEPWPVRFRRQNNRHELSVDGVESHGEQVAARRAALAYTSHHCGVLNRCNGIVEIPQKKRVEKAGRQPALTPGKSICGPSQAEHQGLRKNGSEGRRPPSQFRKCYLS